MATEKRLIDLDDAIANIRIEGLLGSGYSTEEQLEDVCDMLERCHIVDAVEVVHGRWIRKRYDDVCGGWWKWTCSRCDWKIRENPKEFNYCPNCGANMMDGDGNG